MTENYSENLSYYNCIDAFKDVKNPQDWLNCPNCGLKPKVWQFNNGRFTACGCWKTKYDHFSISAESVMSALKNSHDGQSLWDYDIDGLRKNWNHWVKTGELLFDRDKEVPKRW